MTMPKIEFRFRIDKIIQDYWVYSKDPILEYTLDGETWKPVPTVIIEHDERKYVKKQVNAPVRLLEDESVPMPNMPKYPYTTNNLDWGHRSLDM